MTIKALEHFEPIYSSTARYNFIMGGAATGKSVAMSQLLLLDMLSNYQCNWLALRRRQNDLRRSIFPQIVNEIYRCGLQSKFAINNTSMVIKCKHNNNKAMFVGGNDIMKLKSISEINHALIEEADEFNEEEFNVIDSRVRARSHRPNRIFFVFNPPHKTHFIPTRFFNNGEVLPEINEPYYFMNNGVMCMALRSIYKNNPYIDDTVKQVYENYANLPNKNLYETFCLGVWQNRQSGAYFQNDYYDESESNSSSNIIVCDPAYSLTGQGDFTCIIKSSYNSGKLQVNNVVLRKDMTPTEILNNVSGLIDGRTKSVNFITHFYEKHFWRNAAHSNNIKFPITEQPLICDKLIPEALHAWTNKLVSFPVGFSATQTGQEALSQWYGFQGKNQTKGLHDDFPDALICSIHLQGLGQQNKNFYKYWV